MPLTERTAEAFWEGNLTDGKGTITKVSSGALPELPVTWAARTTDRTEGKTSPEELIAAAHASCYSMAFANTLNKHGHPPDRLDVTATCAIDRIDGKTTIVSMDLVVRGRVPGIDQATFEEIAREGEQGCPVSRALRNNVEIRLKAHLEN